MVILDRAIGVPTFSAASSKYPLQTAGGEQLMTFVNEDGLYDLILESRKPEAKAFRKWVTFEVLPAIRKQGVYMTDDVLEKALTDPKFLLKLAIQYDQEHEKRKQAEMQVVQQAQMIEDLYTEVEIQEQTICEQQVTIAEQTTAISKLQEESKYLQIILAARNTVRVTQIAQDYGMSAIAFNRLLAKLKVQFRLNNQWILYMEYKDKGYVTSETFELASGEMVMHTCWTQSGRKFLYYLLKDNGILPTIER